jgi:hypothetical protein
VINRDDQNGKEGNVFIECINSHLYNVSLVDLLRYPDRSFVRSFASSQQLIDWLKTSGSGQRHVTVRRGKFGDEVPAVDYGDLYTLYNGDIEVGRVVVWDQAGLRYLRNQLPGGTG